MAAHESQKMAKWLRSRGHEQIVALWLGDAKSGDPISRIQGCPCGDCPHQRYVNM